MSQSKDTIKNQIIDFYNDALFQKLNAYYCKTTLFNILKIERNENRHSAFLAWLLDIKESHGLGEEPLRRFMRLLAKADSRYDSPFVVGSYRVENERVRLEHLVDNNRRIDVYITFDCFEKDENDKCSNRFCIIIENKVYTEENGHQTQLYYDWAKKDKENKGATIIGVFLSPDKDKTCSCQEYIKIDYQELLVQVIEPLLALEMSDEARWIISDYIVNLGQPKKLVDENGDYVIKEDTILAVSMDNTDCFAKLYKKHKNLLNVALFTVCSDKKKDLETVFKSDYEIIKSKTKKNDAELLRSFWEVNKMLLTMVFDAVFEENNTSEDEETTKQYREAVNKLLNLKSSNRNTKKYLVYAKNGDPMNKMVNGKPKPTPFMSVASYYIFKAWLHEHKGANLKEIREAFPVDEFAQHYCGTYQFLVYRKDDIKEAYRLCANNENDYVIAPMDETKDSKKSPKYIIWDFFKNTEQYCLHLSDCDALSVKMWRENQFKELSAKAHEKHGIEVVEQ